MGKIVKIKKDKTISYEDDRIKYFENLTEKIEKHDFNVDYIEDSKTKIVLSSTQKIDGKLLFELEKKANEGINVYILIKSENLIKSEIGRFSKMLVRVFSDLSNDYIIIDNRGFLFFNPLDKLEDNPFLDLNENETKDLFYSYCYLFWEKSGIEIIQGKPEDIKEKISVPLSNFNDSINFVNNQDFNGDLYLPFNNSSKNLIKNFNNSIYLSKNLRQKISEQSSSITIGSLVINLKKISNLLSSKWILKENSLKNIYSTILPFDEDWSESGFIKIKENEDMILKDISSEKIEDMNNVEPKDFTPKKYIKNIRYIWNVLPPYRANNSKKSKLYDDWSKFNKQKEEIIKNSEDKCKKMFDGEGTIKKWINVFTGKKRKAKELLNDIEEFKSDFSTDYNFKKRYEDLKKIVLEIHQKDNEYQNEIELQKRNDKIEELENKISENETEIKDSEETLENIKSELVGLEKLINSKTEELNTLKKEIAPLESDKQSSKKKIPTIKQNISTLENSKIGVKQKYQKKSDFQSNEAEYSSDLEQELNKIDEKIKSLLEEENQLTENIKGLDEDISALKRAETEKNNELSSLKKDKKNKNSEEIKLDDKVSKLELENEKSKKEIEDLKKKQTNISDSTELDYKNSLKEKNKEVNFPSIPNFQLPKDNIELFEANGEFYIEIEDYGNLEEANRLLYSIYKKGSVVAKKEV
ncbi:hypothetical protein JXR93_01595 [bacterium]|nr:hypothetical protein [bacterium]